MKLQCTHPVPVSPHCRNESYSVHCQILHAMLDSVLVKNRGSPFLRGGYSGICQELVKNCQRVLLTVTYAKYRKRNFCHWTKYGNPGFDESPRFRTS
ncbi:hypothetical protein AVEN_51301-1 [Araneus ventricosus]|uniref:Uncharacterized protein n=1 Tax=Araneus ventricosus TaxID=182803 RepID=A0A4Y2SFD9_ARAVE|nr:hypothetical protein AVEN_51301-1 [Araneus ventricosus]